MQELIKMQKRANVQFFSLLSIVIIISLVYVQIAIHKKPIEFAKELGGIQVAVLNAYNKGERLVFYIDQSAKYSVIKTLSTLAKNGGIISEKEDMFDKAICENYLGYNVLTSQDKNCLPLTNIKETFEIVFNNEFENYLSKYPYLDIGAYIYDEYIIKENGNTLLLIGNSKNNIALDIWNRKGIEFTENIDVALDSSKEQNNSVSEIDNKDKSETKGNDVNAPQPSQISRAGEKCPKTPPSDDFVWDGDDCLSSNCWIRKGIKESLDSARKKAEEFGGRIVLNSGWRNICEQKKANPKSRVGSHRHGTGAAIDVKLVGRDLDCGPTGQDKPASVTGLYSFENDNSPRGVKIHNCRMKLKEIMESVGFMNPSEPEKWSKREYWHWEEGTYSWYTATKGEKGNIKYEVVV